MFLWNATVSFSLLLWFTVVVSAAGDSSPGAPATALPAASDNCAFHDLNSLAQYIVSDWTPSNVSLLVEKCPKACLIVYGAGDPDITGVGAMISYIIQGVTSLVFGPLLALLCLFAGSNPASDSFNDIPQDLWIVRKFAPVARSIHQANIIIAVSVLTASVIHLRGVSPVAEMNFINKLGAYELHTAVICTFSYLPLYESSRLRSAVVKLYLVGCIVMSYIVSAMACYPSSYAEAMQDLATHCVAQNDWPNQKTNVTEAPIKEEIGRLRERTPIILLGFLFLAIVLGLLCLYAHSPYVRFCRALRIGPRRLAFIPPALLMTACSVLVLFIDVWELLWIRQSLQIASGPDGHNGAIRHFIKSNVPSDNSNQTQPQAETAPLGSSGSITMHSLPSRHSWPRLGQEATVGTRRPTKNLPAQL